MGTWIPVFLFKHIPKALFLNRQDKPLFIFVRVDVTAPDPDPRNNWMPQGKPDRREWTGPG
jgi:hypothetical protein